MEITVTSYKVPEPYFILIVNKSVFTYLFVRFEAMMLLRLRVYSFWNLNNL